METNLEELTESQRKRLSEALELQRESGDLADRFCTTVFQAETVFAALAAPLCLKGSVSPTTGRLLALSAASSILSLICGGCWLSARSRMLHRLARRTLGRGRDGNAGGATVETTGAFDELCLRAFLVGAVLSAILLLAALICGLFFP
jgi:hypothetical protein